MTTACRSGDTCALICRNWVRHRDQPNQLGPVSMTYHTLRMCRDLVGDQAQAHDLASARRVVERRRESF
jgi:hypothetical protein